MVVFPTVVVSSGCDDCVIWTVFSTGVVGFQGMVVGFHFETGVVMFQTGVVVLQTDLLCFRLV